MGIATGDLVELLPSVETGHSVKNVSAARDRGYKMVGQRDPKFVEPELRTKEPLEKGTTSVVLVEAPGAVGKSVLAEYLAFRTGGALWDLSEVASVGSDTFNGTLSKVYGFGRGGEVYESLKKGKFVIVMDALDEAFLRAGQEGFEAFLKSLSEQFSEGQSQPGIVLLGRSTSMEWSTLFLESVPFSRHEIDFFSQDKAAEFIDRRMDVHCEGKPHRGAGRANFEELRDLIVKRAAHLIDPTNADKADVLNKDAAVRRVLGYAPVLVGLSEYLCRGGGDWFGRRQEWKEASTGEKFKDVWDLLMGLLDGVLQREQRKVENQMQDLLESAREQGWGDEEGEKIYRPLEQRYRILRHVLGIEHEPLPRGFPRRLRTDYEERLRETFQDHPFLNGDVDGFASVVFCEDMYGWALGDKAASAGQGDAVRARLRKRDYLPSPILARSCLTRAEAGEGSPRVGQSSLGFLYEAVCSEATAEDVVVSVSPTEDESQHWAELKRLTEGGFHKEFYLQDDDEDVLFPRRLANCNIASTTPIKIGLEGGSFRLGPNVRVEAPLIYITAGELTVQTGSDDLPDEYRDVVLIADEAYPGDVDPTVYGTGEFIIDWPNARYPWVNYQREESDGELPGEMRDWLHSLGRIVGAFSAEPGGALTRAQVYVDNVVVGSDNVRNALLGFLKGRGIVREAGDDYLLDRDQLGRYGISLSHLTRGETTSGVEELLVEFSNANKDLGS